MFDYLTFPPACGPMPSPYPYRSCQSPSPPCQIDLSYLSFYLYEPFVSPWSAVLVAFLFVAAVMGLQIPLPQPCWGSPLSHDVSEHCLREPVAPVDDNSRQDPVGTVASVTLCSLPGLGKPATNYLSPLTTPTIVTALAHYFSPLISYHANQYLAPVSVQHLG